MVSGLLREGPANEVDRQEEPSKGEAVIFLPRVLISAHVYSDHTHSSSRAGGAKRTFGQASGCFQGQDSELSMAPIVMAGSRFAPAGGLDAFMGFCVL